LNEKVVDLANVVMGNVLKWNEKKLSIHARKNTRNTNCNCGDTTCIDVIDLSEGSNSDSQP